MGKVHEDNCGLFVRTNRGLDVLPSIHLQTGDHNFSTLPKHPATIYYIK